MLFLRVINIKNYEIFYILSTPSSEIYVLHSASQIGLTTFQELSNHVATALDPAEGRQKRQTSSGFHIKWWKGVRRKGNWRKGMANVEVAV